ncbi:MAG: three-Cys-motif partner protein TcmP [Candidatus Berkelbacteria bacterium]|nr:three-Cys-motif partner protein TcmP [Candidatus Berkelbacteria bacterium]
MSNNKRFFSDQSEITKLKLLFFENYIESYLYKILYNFGSCRLFDPFCGPGRAGDNLGSPLVLLNKLRKVVATPTIKNHLKFEIILFCSDSDKSNIASIEKETAAIKIENVKVICKNQTFDEFHDFVTKSKIAPSKTPKFIFLDPFGYSQIPLNKIEQLAALPNCEILLFVPLMDIYRFSNQDPTAMEKGSRVFLETYTNRAMTGGKTFTNPQDLMMVINITLKTKLNKYVRPMMFDAGSRKNCLFLITKNIKGLILANELFCKGSDTRLNTKITGVDKNTSQGKLDLEVDTVDEVEFKGIITKALENGKLNNIEMTKLYAENYFCQTSARAYLTKLIKKDIIGLTRLGKTSQLCIGATNLSSEPKVEFYLK